MNEEKQLIVLPGCKVCPSCYNHTLPRIEKDSHKTATRCQNTNCGAVVDRTGHIESVEITLIPKIS